MRKFYFVFLFSALFCPVLAAAARPAFFGPNLSGPGLCQVDLISVTDDGLEIMFGITDTRGAYIHFEVVSLQRDPKSSVYENRESSGSDPVTDRRFFRRHTLEIIGEDSNPQDWKQLNMILLNETQSSGATSLNPIYICSGLRRPSA